ncbi:hypothetical protein [Pilimelia columellifera]|uniref:Uncharacterized protein n=1 Tax=Pilimelia columellifera subsp. columellifera TaxID=706583 RepID=A0ABN3N991_9ACTN
MWPHPAAVARALAAATRPASLYLACRPSPQLTRYICDPHGTVLLLARDDSPAAHALRPTPGEDDVAAVLEIVDDPDQPDLPSLGRVWLSGWVAPLSGVGARAAALDFAAVHPLSDLLDVGRGVTLYRLELAEVRLERGDRSVDIVPEDFAAAAPACPGQLARLRARIAPDSAPPTPTPRLI